MSRKYERLYYKITEAAERTHAFKRRPVLVQRIEPDQVFSPEAELHAFLPLHQELRGRLVLCEHYSGSMRAPQRDRLRALLLALSSRWLQRPQPAEGERETVPGSWFSETRMPAVVIVAPSYPQALLQEGILVPTPYARGVWSGLGFRTRLFYLATRLLDPDEPGWDLLRWTDPGTDENLLRRFFDADTFDQRTKDAVMRTLNDQIDLSAYKGLERPYTALQNDIRTSFEEGIELVVDAWLRSVEDQLPEACAAEIRAIEDPQKRFEALQRALED